MVPITVLAFICAKSSIETDYNADNFENEAFDIVGIIIVGMGVFIHNFYQEKS